MSGMLVLAAIVVVSTIFIVEQQAPDDQQYRFWHFNMCGNVCNEGSTIEVVGAVARSIVDFKPVAVSLNEVCQSQYSTLRRALDRAGYPMNGRWVITRDGGSECEDGKYGMAVLSRREIRAVRSWRLPRPTAETRKLLCITTTLSRDARVCTTHITPDDADEVPQIDKVAGIVNGYAARTPTVVMGDFNVSPTETPLDRLYSDEHGEPAHGLFRECDEGHGLGPPCRCGEPTQSGPVTDSKIDYIFVSAEHWRAVEADATQSEYSDHDPLRGWAALES